MWLGHPLEEVDVEAVLAATRDTWHAPDAAHAAERLRGTSIYHRFIRDLVHPSFRSPVAAR
jgi:hypothetical protein